MIEQPRSCAACTRPAHVKGYCTFHYYRWLNYGDPNYGPGKGRQREPIRHGTEGGARTHYRREEQPCELCRKAHNRAKVDRTQNPTNSVDEVAARRQQKPTGAAK